MKLRKFWHLLSMMLLISPLIGACVYSYPERHLSDFRVELNHPYDGAVIDLSETFVTGNVYHGGRDLSRLIFYANGRIIGETASLEAFAEDSSSFGEINWTPPAVGEYLLQVEAETSPGPDVISHPVRVCVIDFEIEGGTFGDIYGYEGPCDIPPRDASAVPGPITLSARAAPESLTYYNFLPELIWYCPEVSAILSFEATLQDPPEDVAFVVIYYSMTYSSRAPFYPGESRTHALVLTQTGTVEPGTEIYTGSTGELSAQLGDYFYGVGAGDITWIARAIGRSGETVLEDGPYMIPANSSCRLIITFTDPSPTPTLIATATLEPSELTCPPGTYYAPVTNKCIAIEIKTPKPGGGGANCSQYGTLNSCTAAGCTWDFNQNSCK